MKMVSAKVGSVPMMIDVKGKRVFHVGDSVQWRRHFLRGDKWSHAIVLRVNGPEDAPDMIFLERM